MPALRDLLLRVAHGGDDVAVARAATQVTTQGVEDLLVAGVRVIAQQGGHRHQESGRAEAALHAVLLVEGLLYGSEPRTVWRKALDRLDLRALDLHGEHQAGALRLAVHEHRARAADAVLAADM